MRDIARSVGVSQTTVSRILSGTDGQISIAAETRERVLAEAERLGYRPNPLAAALRGARTMLLGLIVREITDPFFAVAVEAISAEAKKHGYNVVLGIAHSQADEAIELRAVLETRHCDALLMIGDMRDQPKMLEDLSHAHVPVVAMWQGSDLSGVPIVNVDNRSGITAVLDHLGALGHRQIALVAGEPFAAMHERSTAYVDWMAAAGLPVPDGYIRLVPNDPSGAEAALKTLTSLETPPTAIVCTTDLLAIGVLHGAAEAGIKVPEELSVTGFDDLPVSQHLVPGLTTLRMPIRDMVARAVGIAIGQIAVVEAVQVMQPSLVIRGSTAEPSG
jgi:DNA-binding LacI/PurR family transcriptional regulator